MTKKNFYEALVNFAVSGDMSYETEDGMVAVEASALKEFAEKEINLLNKRAASAKAAAAKKKEEVSPFTEAVFDALSDEFECISDITERVEVEDATVSKVVYQLNKLVKLGKAEKQPISIKEEGKKTRSIQGYKRVVSE